jgi:cytochrome P450
MPAPGAGCPVDDSFDPLSPEFLADPFAVLAGLGPAGRPVFFAPRKPAARAFSMTRVQAMIPAIESTTARLLDDVAGQEEFDLVAALAFPLPANIVFSLMGVPE